MDSRIFVFDRLLKLQGILSNEEEKENACPFWDAPNEETLELLNDFSFFTEADHPEAAHLKNGCFVGFFDEDGDFQLFESYFIEDTASADGLIREVRVSHVMNELERSIVEDKRPFNQSNLVALQGALSYQDKWQVGNVAPLGNASTNFYYISAKESLHKIKAAWGGDIKPRIGFEDNEITGFYIDHLTRRGADTGKRITLNNADRIVRSGDELDVRTALYVRGSGEELETGGYSRRVKIDEVEWSVANGDPIDKPLGQEWIGDEEARLLYGIPDGNGGFNHSFGVLTVDDETDPEKLIQVGYEALQETKQPLFSWDIEAEDLEELLGYSHEKVRLGDTIPVLVPEFNPPIMVAARVIGRKRWKDDVTRATYTLGNHRPLLTDRDRDFEDFKEKVGGKAWQPPVIGDSNLPDIVPPVPFDVRAIGLFRTIMLKWQFETPLYIAAYEVYGSQTPDFTPSSENLLFRGKQGGFVHDADTDTQWYYRVRTVNTQGTPSAYSEQVTAQTRRIDTVDYEELSILDAFIMNVSADKLTAGTIDAGYIDVINLNASNIVAGFLLFDFLRGGEMTLGGFNNINGRMRVLNENGDVNADVDGNNAAYERLYAGDFRSPVVPNYNDRSYTIFVDISGGSDENDGTSSTNAFNSIQHAINQISKVNDGNVTIEIYGSGSSPIVERINISGFVGRGSIFIDFRLSSRLFNGRINIRGNTNHIEIDGKYSKFSGKDQNEIINIERCTYITIRQCRFYGNNSTLRGIRVADNSAALIRDNHFYDMTDGVLLETISRINGNNNVGSVSQYGYSAYGTSQIGHFANRPTGGVADIWTSQTSQQIGQSVDSTPPPKEAPPPPDTTNEWITTGSPRGDAWRPQFGGQWWQDNSVVQGGWAGFGAYKGLWLFGNNPSNAVTGKTIKSIRIFVTRKSNGGKSVAISCTFRPHTYATRPNGEPAYQTPSVNASFKWGEGKWITLPSSFYAGFQNGTTKGIGIFVNSTSENSYAKFDVNATLEITYA